MDDPSRFTSINEYYTFIYAISYMILVELGIWIYNFKGWLKRPDKKNNDLHEIFCENWQNPVKQRITPHFLTTSPSNYYEFTTKE